MLLAYPYCFILFLNSDIDLGVREGDVHLRCDLRKSAKEFAPMAAAFVTAFSTPPAADTCAPTFQGLSTRSRNVVSASGCGVNVCGDLDFASSALSFFNGGSDLSDWSSISCRE